MADDILLDDDTGSAQAGCKRNEIVITKRLDESQATYVWL
jgi:hypothetical protein